MKAAKVSERKISFTVYGHRDGKTVGWIKEALDGYEIEPEDAVLPQPKPQPQAQPDPTTLDDQALLQILLDKKAIDWDATTKYNRSKRLGAGVI